MDYDLGNMCAYSLQSIDPSSVKQGREAKLLELAVAGTQQLVRQLFQLPVQPSEAGPLVCDCVYVVRDIVTGRVAARRTHTVAAASVCVQFLCSERVNRRVCLRVRRPCGAGKVPLLEGCIYDVKPDAWRVCARGMGHGAMVGGSV